MMNGVFFSRIELNHSHSSRSVRPVAQFSEVEAYRLCQARAGKKFSRAEHAKEAKLRNLDGRH